MLCITEVPPPKAPDGRTLLVDAITGTQYRTFRHGIVDDKSTSSNNPSNTLSKISKDLTTKKNKKHCTETPNTTSVIKKSQKISQEIVMRKIKS